MSKLKTYFTPVLDQIVESHGRETALAWGIIWRLSRKHGHTQARHEFMADLCGVSVKTFYRHLRILLDAGKVEDLDPGKTAAAHRYKPLYYELPRYLAPGWTKENYLEYVYQTPEDPGFDPRAGMIPKEELEYMRYEFSRLRDRLHIGLVAKAAPRCIECGTYRNLTMDHVVPLARGGQNTIANLQWLCQSCNSKKGASCE